MCPRLNAKQQEQIAKLHGNSGYDPPWRRHLGQPQGSPFDIKKRRATLQAPGYDHEVTGVYFLFSPAHEGASIVDAGDDCPPTKTTSIERRHHLITVPCDTRVLRASAVNALCPTFSPTPAGIFPVDHDGLPLPVECATPASWHIQYSQAVFKGHTFETVARRASKNPNSSVCVGDLVLCHDNSSSSLDMSFTLPVVLLALAGDKNHDEPQLTWRLTVEVPCRLPSSPLPSKLSHRSASSISMRGILRRVANRKLIVPSSEAPLRDVDRWLCHFFWATDAGSSSLELTREPIRGVDSNLVYDNIVPLLVHDLKSLDGCDTSINDEIINWFAMIVAFHARSEGILVMTLNYFEKLNYWMGLPLPQRLQQLHRWFKRVRLRDIKKMVVPIHLPNHWTLAVLRDLELRDDSGSTTSRLSGSAVYYDSCRGFPERIFDLLEASVKYSIGMPPHSDPRRQVVVTEGLGWERRVRQPDSDPKQGTTMNCGMFLIKTLHAELGMTPLEQVDEEHMLFFRERCAIDILRHPQLSFTAGTNIPIPALSLAQALGALPLNPNTEHRNCAPLAFLLAYASSGAATLHAHPPSDATATRDLLHWLRDVRVATRLSSSRAAVHAVLSDTSVIASRGVEVARSLLASVHNEPLLLQPNAPVPLLTLSAALMCANVKVFLVHGRQRSFDGCVVMGDRSVPAAQVCAVFLYMSAHTHLVSLSFNSPLEASRFVGLVLRMFPTNVDCAPSSFEEAGPIEMYAPSKTWVACGDLHVTPRFAQSIEGNFDDDGLANGACRAKVRFST